MAKIFEWVRQLISGKDNTSPDATKIIALLAGMQGLFLQGWEVVAKGAAFDMQSFGIGVGALLTTLGVALGLKKDDPADKEK